MSAIVYLPGKPPRTVRNLGWILRNWMLAESVAFYYSPSGAASDGRLVVNLRGGGRYETDFASLSVCASWFGRSKFRGLPFIVHASGRDIVHECGTYPCKSSWRGRYQDHLAACLGESAGAS